MKILRLKKKPFDENGLKRLFAEERDCENLVEGHFILIDDDTNEIVAVNAPIDDVRESEILRTALLNLKNWTVASRGSGLKTTAKVFGYQPRTPIRQRPFCHRGVLSKEQPGLHKMICDFSPIAEKIFKEHVPEAYEKQRKELLDKVKPEWRMAHGGFNVYFRYLQQ